MPGLPFQEHIDTAFIGGRFWFGNAVFRLMIPVVHFTYPQQTQVTETSFLTATATERIGAKRRLSQGLAWPSRKTGRKNYSVRRYTHRPSRRAHHSKDNDGSGRAKPVDKPLCRS